MIKEVLSFMCNWNINRKNEEIIVHLSLSLLFSLYFKIKDADVVSRVRVVKEVYGFLFK